MTETVTATKIAKKAGNITSGKRARKIKRAKKLNIESKSTINSIFKKSV